MTPVFLDTVGLVAIWNHSDQWHAAAMAIFTGLIQRQVPLLQAWDDYARGLAGSAGIVDHVSFTLMRRLGITEAFTHNGHFVAAGFTTLF